MSKKLSIFDRFWGPIWHLGSKMEPDRVHKGLLSQVGSPGGPRGSPGVNSGRNFDDFWSYSDVFWVTLSEGFRVCSLIVSHGLLMFLVLMSTWLLHRFQFFPELFSVVKAAPQARLKTT